MRRQLSNAKIDELYASDSKSADKRPLRLLVVAPSIDILGGQAVQAARLISRLRELPFFEVGFLAINPRLPGVLRNLQSIKYVRTVITSVLYIVNLFATVRQYDVIHIFSASYFSFLLAPTPAILTAKLFGKKILLNYHSGEAKDHLKRWRSAISTLRLVDQIVVPSAYLVEVFASFGIQAEAINNHVELDQFKFRERKSVRPLFLSNRNLEIHYGVHHVLRAFALIQEQIPQAELVVAGDGSQRKALESLARDLGLRHTRFVGRVEPHRIFDQYQAADVYLNGSEIDNQPLSILEAFACGLPIVTTNAGGIRDMVSDDVTGCVVSPGDYQALADRSLSLLAEPDRANSIALRAREECDNYSWHGVRDEWVRVYRRLGSNNLDDSVANEDRKSTSGSRGLAGQIRRIRQMTIAELQVRCSQAVAASAERKGWSSLSKLPTDRGLLKLLDSAGGDRGIQVSAQDTLESFRLRRLTSFAVFSARGAAVAELRSRWPTAEAQIIAEADAILGGRFDLLGFKDLSFGNPINWQLEPISAKVAPTHHWSRIDYLNPDVIGDKKIVWELNRQQYFSKLGQAYWLTLDEKYASVFVDHLNSWMDQNSPKNGINWASSLEVSFRSISWLWGLHFFQQSPTLEAKTFTRVLKFLYLNARHLETYLSTYFSPNTHLTGEALGLFYLGTVLSEFHDAKRWREQGQAILLAQLEQQIKPDGVYFEQSSYYHRYTTDFYTHLLILLKAPELQPDCGERVNSGLEEKLQALLDHLMYITLPDGTSPLFGDDDGGRLVTLDHQPANDFRATLSTGAVLFNRSDYKFVARELAQETLWLLGVEGVRAFDRIEAREPSQQSKEFPDGGYYVMRDGWHDKANYLLFDCGPHGATNCGHAHADALSVEVAANGKRIIVDPGTYTYTASKHLRDEFRGSKAHNVLLVDNEPSSLPDGPFSWNTIARCEPLSWISERRFDLVEGRHDGYERLQDPVTHTRGILFLKNDYWLIRDHVRGAGSHDLQLKFHLAPSVNFLIKTNDSDRAISAVGISSNRKAAGESAGLQAVVFGEEGEWRRENGFVSQSYGHREAAEVWTFSASKVTKGRNATELITVLLPNSSPVSSKFSVREVEAIGGHALEITSQEYRDMVLMRDVNRKLETAHILSDFNWSWARFSRSGVKSSEGLEDAGELLEVVLLDGQRFEVDGTEIVTSGRKIKYLVASRVGNQFRVETEEGTFNVGLPIPDLASFYEKVERGFLV